MSALSLKNIHKVYDKSTIIENLSLEIASGEFIVLVGPSGCGKSTLLRMIAGLESPDGGTLKMGDRDVTEVAAGKRNLSMVFQSYALYPHMTVKENLSFGLRNLRTPADEIDKRITHAATMLKLDEMLDRLPQNLSGGQRQRVAIGRSIVQQPELFLFDEPLSNLDAALRVEMRQEIQQLHNTLKNTMIYVTHDQVEAMTLADRIVVLYKGKIEQVGTPLELYNHPANLFVAEFIGTPKINILPAVWRAGALHIADALTFPLSRPLAGMSDGDKVFVAIRPEHIQYQQEGDFAITAKTRLCELQGDSTLVWMDLNGHSLCLKSFQQLSFAPGTSLSLTVQESHLHLFDALGKRVAER
ncbi:ABC transporter ATP-binding protein [Pseudocitrobacter faecalis]|uniref:Carbohydrate ABC transporter ATP-binding protein (CUT1 family) n=1 Tax=Pseudocitrobacter faecalis TaxID=1398493 RepID=A0ABX9G651_9ENTR|nr:carbohydrate ABC transporter ATP-binding protein (CUT1 family) [Pseudocitrobacter faecalis]